MDILFKGITVLLLFALLASPLAIRFGLERGRFQKSFILYIILGIAVTFILVVIMGWWSDFSNELLLSHYGYDFDAMNATDRFKNVASEHLAEVKRLQTNRLGIGWPLKAMLAYLFFSPILLLLYVTAYFVRRKKIKSAF